MRRLRLESVSEVCPGDGRIVFKEVAADFAAKSRGAADLDGAA